MVLYICTSKIKKEERFVLIATSLKNAKAGILRFGCITFTTSLKFK
jgi:hypothetical protein